MELTAYIQDTIHLNTEGLPFPRQQLCLSIAIREIAVPNRHHIILRRMPNVYAHLSIYSVETIGDQIFRQFIFRLLN